MVYQRSPSAESSHCKGSLWSGVSGVRMEVQREVKAMWLQVGSCELIKGLLTLTSKAGNHWMCPHTCKTVQQEQEKTPNSTRTRKSVSFLFQCPSSALC